MPWRSESVRWLPDSVSIDAVLATIRPTRLQEVPARNRPSHESSPSSTCMPKATARRASRARASATAIMRSLPPSGATPFVRPVTEASQAPRSCRGVTATVACRTALRWRPMRLEVASARLAISLAVAHSSRLSVIRSAVNFGLEAFLRGPCTTTSIAIVNFIPVGRVGINLMPREIVPRGLNWRLFVSVTGLLRIFGDAYSGREMALSGNSVPYVTSVGVGVTSTRDTDRGLVPWASFARSALSRGERLTVEGQPQRAAPTYPFRGTIPVRRAVRAGPRRLYQTGILAASA